MKQSTKDTIKKLYLYAKLITVLVLISAVTYGIGTFMPNPIAVKKATEETRVEHAIWAEKLGLHEPSFDYTSKKEFILEVNKCVDYLNWKTPPGKRVPIQMVTAQAALESGWGTSRFAIEANNLFGIKTWDKDKGLLPIGMSKDTPWRLRIFITKCNSVQEYIRILNEHPAYKEFRELRTKLLEKGELLDSVQLIATLDKFSTTEDYDKRVIDMIAKIEKVLATVDENSNLLKKNTILPEDKPK
jgi:flagellum-specific peptidoglycan hydrolase FlgJ